MRHPMIAALLGLIGNAVAAVQMGANSAYRLGTSPKRGREGSHATRASTVGGMMQSYKDKDWKLRGYAGAKMARKAKAKTLGLRHGTSSKMKWGGRLA